MESRTAPLRYTAFTRDGAGGNPAGVVLAASGMSDEQMLAIAAGLGYSETAFVTERHGLNRMTVRYFSPLAEVPFCGHATVGLAAALAEHEDVQALQLTTAAGEIAVELARDASGAVLATLRSVPTHTREASAEDVEQALRALRWTPAQLDPRYPVHLAYAGAEHMVLAVRSRQTLAELDYDYPALAALMAERGWVTMQCVWAETPVLFHARNPFPPGGVWEDPATGAAAAALGGYLRDLNLAPVPSTVTVLQGEENGTPSLLRVELETGTRTVLVSGSARRIA